VLLESSNYQAVNYAMDATSSASLKKKPAKVDSAGIASLTMTN
jgi:hypothetical protein